MTDCKHRNITTFVFEETGEPAGMWSCRACGLRFYPATQLLAEVAQEREACAQVCEDMIGTRAMARHCADKIRDRGQA